jgi:hypothetical protein
MERLQDGVPLTKKRNNILRNIGKMESWFTSSTKQLVINLRGINH